MVIGRTYEYIKDGIKYSSVFKAAEFLPEKSNVSSALSVPILNNKVILVRQSDTGWWDIPGGHLEAGEDYLGAAQREVEEEAGVSADNHRVIGYFEITSTIIDPEAKEVYASPSMIVVTLSFVQKYISEWDYPQDINDRALVSFKHLDDYLVGRGDNSQMKEVLLYAKKILEEISVVYEFGFIKKDIDPSLPVTQVYGFCRDSKSGNFCLVRETGSDHFGLPGGGCEVGESPRGAFERELMEETQLKGENIRVVGATKIDMYLKDGKKHLQTILQFRFYADILNIPDFVPNRDGFEIEERIFVPFSDLSARVDWLKTEVGLLIINEINTIHGASIE